MDLTQTYQREQLLKHLHSKIELVTCILQVDEEMLAKEVLTNLQIWYTALAVALSGHTSRSCLRSQKGT